MAYSGQGKLAPVSVFSASLSPAGAFSASTAVPCGDFETAVVLVNYLSGAAGGGCKFYVQHSNGSEWFDETVKVASGSVSGGYRSDLKTDYNFLDTNSQKHKASFNIAGSKSIRVQVAEYGVTGTPGVAAVEIALKKE